MNWYYIYQTSNGQLISETSVQPTSLPAGMAYVTESTRQNGNVWNPSTLTFSPPPNSPVMSTLDFLNRFTSTERQAIRASTDVNVQDFLWMLQFPQGQNVDLTNPTLIAGMDYLVSVNLLTATRQTAIMTP